MVHSCLPAPDASEIRLLLGATREDDGVARERPEQRAEHRAVRIANGSADSAGMFARSELES